MKFVITRTSDYTPYVKTFDTLEDLMNFQKTVNEELIIKQSCWYNGSISSLKYYNISEKVASEIITIENEIEIYDDYRE